jgi:hypothetical protein
MEMKDFPAAYIYEKMLKEAIYEKSGKVLKHLIVKEAFQEKAIELINNYQKINADKDAKKHLTTRELQA